MISSVLQANTCTIETLNSIEEQVSRFKIDECNDWIAENWSAFGWRDWQPHQLQQQSC